MQQSNVGVISTARRTPAFCDSDEDRYGSSGKEVHRYSFARACVRAKKTSPITNDILYTESSDGAATEELLKAGFLQRHLHPCNDNKPCKDSNATATLQARFPEAVVEEGDIHDIYKKQHWLGVWFDLEETWHTKQEWNAEKVPDFKKAKVVAVSLSSRGIHGGAEALAKDVDHLLYDNGGHQEELCRAYNGKSGVMNMVFGLAFFKEPPITPSSLFIEVRLKELSIPIHEFAHYSSREWPDKDKYKVINGCYRAVVVKIQGETFYVNYMNTDNNYFSTDDETTFEDIKKWWHGTSSRCASIGPLHVQPPSPPSSVTSSTNSSSSTSSTLKRIHTNVCPGCSRKKGCGFPPKKQWHCGECS